MRRSQTVESGERNDDDSTSKKCSSPSTKKERWSFAIKRRWFSSSTSRQSHDHHDVAIVVPQKTTLGGSTSGGAAESGSVPDRPDESSGSAVSKRKSLRRIFANSSKERSSQSNAASSSSSSAVTNRQSTSALPPNGHTSSTAESSSSAQQYPIGVLSSGEQPSTAANNSTTPSVAASAAAVTTPRHSLQSASTVAAVGSSQEEEKPEDNLPPPMQNITLNNTNMEESTNDVPAPAADATGAAEEAAPAVAEKTPEEMARFKRQYVLMELVETEQDYVRDLTSVVEGYIGNLEKMDLPADLVGKDKIIFANIAQILDFHKTCFLKEIEKSTENYEAAGAAFVKYERRLHTLYVKYCQNKPKSDYLVSQDDFEAFFAETKAKLGHKVALCDLLIKPVQRIMKYQLLLKDILKFTDRAKDRNEILLKALHVMHVVPKACDDMMQVGRLQNFDGNLGAQGKLIHQGTLQISESAAGTTQKPKDRRIFLFEQSAIFADHIPPKKEFGNPTYIFKNQIMVNKMVFDPVVPEDPLRFVIRSSDPSQGTMFIANAQTLEEKEEWVSKISEQLDQQKRLLAALVDPKRYMGGGDDLSSAMGSISMGPPGGGGNDKKNAPTSAPAKAGSSKKNSDASPKKESKSKSLFSFGKKPAKSPTSPPPLTANASCDYRKIREDEIDLKADEKVTIRDVKNGFARVEKSNGTIGKVPNYYLQIDEIPGENFAEQIEYRRNWYRRVDEIPCTTTTTTDVIADFDVILEMSKCQRPVITKDLEDVEAVEGDIVELAPVIVSHTDFTIVWHGPAVESKRARIQTNGSESRLIIERVNRTDIGAYSAIARNSFGVTSTVAFLNVILIPDADSFSVASTNITKAHVSLRNFVGDFYTFRVFAYNHRVRSDPSACVTVDFHKNIVN
ncbi:unnamed protein product [Caenorhabditis bovis]|uniref:Uncharacterized protein n=1 Tax=Caenorhabditis bovis TaxID=2654633 RepID=A0A8S1F6I5_9PELO|nr:unnamed protein product [Caenorhabditis bovis]